MEGLQIVMLCRLTLLASALIVVASLPALAETAPGDACTAGQTNHVRLVGGPETTGTADILRCNGSTWTSQIRFTSAGKVGIGMTNPVANLTVIGDGNVSGTIYAAGGNAYIDSAGVGASSNAGAYNVGNFNASGALALYAGNAEKLRIASTGDVGIGTTTPDMMLVVRQPSAGGTANLAKFRNEAGAVDLTIKEGVTGLSAISLVTGSGDNLSFGTQGREEDIVIDLTGNVGIGKNDPQSALHVPDGKYLQAEDNNAGAPPAADCDNNAERGRLSIDTTNNRLYVCNGATRGWDYVALTN